MVSDIAAGDGKIVNFFTLWGNVEPNKTTAKKHEFLYTPYGSILYFFQFQQIQMENDNFRQNNNFLLFAKCPIF
jgi:hypothetical protein